MSEPVYPLWLRIWHMLHGIAFLVLLLTGLRVHYADTSFGGLPFAWSVRLHDAVGVVYAGLWLFFVVANVWSKNVRHYRPDKAFLKGAVRQMRWYLHGMLVGEPEPFAQSRERKFNPLQAASYLGVMYALMPACAVSGCFLLFPELAPEQVAGAGGIWPMALLHLATSWALSLFLVTHLYMVTTGPRATSYLREMVTGDLDVLVDEEPGAPGDASREN